MYSYKIIIRIPIVVLLSAMLFSWTAHKSIEHRLMSWDWDKSLQKSN